MAKLLPSARSVGVGLAAGVRVLTWPLGRNLGTRIAAHAAATLAPVVTTKTPRGALRFCCTSAASAKRATNFLSHEPDTREWIDSAVKPGEHFWDIGANVGAYSLYACLGERVTATAFEPMPATFAVLARNIELNELGQRVTPLSLALSDKHGVVPIYFTSREAGSAMHALGRPENVRGAFVPAGQLDVLTMTGDEAVRSFGLRAPDHVKIDVDGHESRVLEGMRELLPSVQSVWVEISDPAADSREGAHVAEFLLRLGFAASKLASSQQGRNRLFVNQALRR